MAKAKKKSKRSADREFVWLQCSESGDLNYRTSVPLAMAVMTRVQ